MRLWFVDMMMIMCFRLRILEEDRGVCSCGGIVRCVWNCWVEKLGLLSGGVSSKKEVAEGACLILKLALG